MRRVTWLIAAVAPLIVAGCANPYATAELRPLPLTPLSGDEVLRTDLAPSRGDVVGFGGSLIGQLAAGTPGGAVLGLSGQLAGGNGVGKATGSTLGALLGSMLGPLGSVVGSLFGGYIGEQTATGKTEVAAGGPAPGYIDGLDPGPLREKSS